MYFRSCGNRGRCGIEFFKRKAGSGFDQRSLKTVYTELTNLRKVKRPVREKVDDESVSVWVEPKLLCEVEYASFSKDGLLREPVFLRLRPDLSFQE